MEMQLSVEANEGGRLLVLVAAAGDGQGVEEERAFDAAASDGEMEIAEENEAVEMEGLALVEGTVGVVAETQTADAVAC